jgi:hypothetical protein
MSLLILWCGVSQLNHCYMVFFIIMILFQCITVSVEVLGVFQQNLDDSPAEEKRLIGQIWPLVLGILNIALYVVGMGFVFYTYREVKAWSLENPNAGYDMMAPLGGGMGMGGGMGRGMTQMTNVGANSNTQLENGGEGRVGADGGTGDRYDAFQGKGVVLG